MKKERAEISAETENKAEENIRKFLDEFIIKLPTKDLNYEIKSDKNDLFVNIDGQDTGYLIGYRGNVLNSLQNVINNIANNDTAERVRVIVKYRWL